MLTGESEAVPKTLETAFSVLLAVSNAGPAGADAAQLRAATGVQRRSVYRHLRALRELGMVEPAATSGHFRLGPMAAGLAVRATDQRTFVRRAQLFAEEVTERTGEPAHVTVYDHGTSMTVASAASPAHDATTVPTVLGSRRPAHASASGKVFLAYDPRALRAYLTRPLQAVTAGTITDPGVLKEECRTIMQRGYSTDQQENIVGVCCLAVPVHGLRRPVVGALVISVLQSTIDTELRDHLLEHLRPAAAEFSQAIGGDGR